MSSLRQTVRTYVAATAACFAAISGGSCMTWPSSALSELSDKNADFQINSEEGSWVASTIALGAIPGAFLAGFLSEKIGRRWTLMSLGIPFLICWLTIGLAERVELLYFARFIAGLSAGGAMMCCPMYNVEISNKDNRGILGSFYTIFMTIGMFLTLVSSTGLKYRMQTIVLACPPILLIIGVFIFCPESPIYLVKNGRKQEAEDVLTTLHGREKAILIIQDLDSATYDKPDLRFLMKDKAFVMAIIISMGISASSQLCGVSFVISYTETIFKIAGSDLSPKNSALIIMGVQVIAAVMQIVVVKLVGRRVLLLQNIIVCLVALSAIGTYAILQDTDEYDLSSLSWLPLVSLIIFLISYVWGLGPISAMIMGELFASDAKEHAFSVAVVINWAVNFGATKSFAPLVSAIGIGATFLIFAGFMVLSLVHALVFVPETKGKTLKEIQDKLYGIKK